jgi:hypothetical protein
MWYVRPQKGLMAAVLRSPSSVRRVTIHE